MGPRYDASTAAAPASLGEAVDCLAWNVGAAAFLRNLTQLGVSWCEALAQSQISMPWTATDPQDHVGGCAPHNPNATSPRPADTRQGARPSESVNRMRTTQLVRTYSASQLLLVGRKGPRKENSNIFQVAVCRSFNLRGYRGRRRRARRDAAAGTRVCALAGTGAIHLAITWQEPFSWLFAEGAP